MLSHSKRVRTHFDEMEALVKALEVVEGNLGRHQALIAEARSRREQLANEADTQLAALLQQRQDLQVQEEQRAAMAANLKHAEEGRARAREACDMLKQEIQQLQDEIAALAQEDAEEKEEFVRTCADMLKQSKALMAEVERAVAGVAGPPAPPQAANEHQDGGVRAPTAAAAAATNGAAEMQP